MKKVLSSILFVVYSVIAIAVTVLLLSYNDYNNSEIGGYTVYIVSDDSLEPEYKQGSILLIRKTSDKNVQIGDEMFLYKVINSQEYEMVVGSLEEKNQQGNHIVYTIENEQNFASDYFIGKTSDTTVIEGWGYVLGILESKWGYLFCVVIVSLLLFLQQVFELIMEIKYGNKNNNEIKSNVSKKHVVEVEYEDDEAEEEEEIVEVKPKKTTTKKTTKTTAKKSSSTTARKKSTTKTAKEEE